MISGLSPRLTAAAAAAATPAPLTCSPNNKLVSCVGSCVVCVYRRWHGICMRRWCRNCHRSSLQSRAEQNIRRYCFGATLWAERNTAGGSARLRATRDEERIQRLVSVDQPAEVQSTVPQLWSPAFFFLFFLVKCRITPTHLLLIYGS